MSIPRTATLVAAFACRASLQDSGTRDYREDSAVHAYSTSASCNVGSKPRATTVNPWRSAPWDEDRDWEFTTGAQEPIEDSIALYRAAIDRSRATVAGRGLDDLAAAGGDRPFNLRFVLFHMVEETARHLGHLDVLRELLDGTTGE